MTTGVAARCLGVGCGTGVTLLLGSLYQPVLIHGTSMEPALRARQLVWLDRTRYQLHPPRRGDVVVFRLGGDTCVKRIYRGPGERLHCLEVRGLNVGPIQESNLAACRERLSGLPFYRIYPVVVPDDAVYVLGDNSSTSVDSRTFGPVPIRSLLGRVRTPFTRFEPTAVEFSLPPRQGERASSRAIPPSSSSGDRRRERWSDRPS